MRVGDYELEDELGRGGMGAVYRARHPSVGPVALKVMTGVFDETDSKRFLREARAGLAVAHPNVLRVLDAGTDKGRPYIVLELAPGGSIADRLKREARIPWPDVARLGAGIARGLAAVHAAGFIHRDLKPANVLLDAEGTPRVADFGLVKPQDRASSLTGTSVVVGTPHFMAPEQADGQPASFASDLYGLGCVLFAMLVGEPPFLGSGFDLLKRVLRETPRSVRSVVPDVPPELDALVARLLAKKPGERGSLDDVVRTLEALDSPEEPRAASSPPRRVGAIVGALVVACVAAAIAGVASRPGRGPQPSAPPEVGSEAKAFSAPSELTPETAKLLTSARGTLRPTWLRDRADRTHPSPILSLAYSPDGRLLASGADEAALVWDVATGRLEGRYAGWPGVVAVAFDRGGTHLAVAQNRVRVTVTDLATKERRTVDGLSSRQIVALAPGPVAETFLAIDEVGRCYRFPARGGSATDDGDRGTEPVGGVAVSPDGRQMIVVRAGAARLRSTDARAPERELAKDVLCAAFLPGNVSRPVLATRGGVLVIDPTSGRLADTLPLRLVDDEVREIAVAPDGRAVALRGRSLALARLRGSGGDARWTTTELRPGSGFVAGGLAFSPDGRRLACGGSDCVLRTWDVSDPERAVPLGPEAAPLDGIAASRDGRRVVLAGRDGVVRLLDTTTGDATVAWDARAPLAGACIAEDGGVIVAATVDGRVRSSRGASGELQRELVPESTAGPPRPPVSSIGLDAAGKLLLAESGNELRLHDLARGQVRAQGLARIATAVAVTRPLSADGTRALASGQGVLALWDGNAGAVPRELELVALHAALSRGGTRFVVARFPPPGLSLVVEVRRFDTGELVGEPIPCGKGIPRWLAFVDEDTVAFGVGDEVVFASVRPGVPVDRVSFRALADAPASVEGLGDGSCLVATFRGRIVRFERRAPPTAPFGVRSRELDGDLSALTSSAKTLRLTWSWGDPRPVHPEELTVLTYSPDGLFLASGSSGLAVVREVKTGRLVATVAGRSAVTALAFDLPLGSVLVGWHDGTITSAPLDGGPPRTIVRRGAPILAITETLRDGRGLYATPSGVNSYDPESEVESSAALPPSAVTAATFSPDRTLILTVARNGLAMVQDWRKKDQSLRTAKNVTAGAFVPGTSSVVLAVKDELQLLDWAKPGAPPTVIGKSADGIRILALAVEPRGRRVAASDRSVQVFTIGWTGARALSGRRTIAPTALAFSPDGKLAIGRDGVPTIWHADSGLPSNELEDEPFAGCTVATSRDGRRVALGGRDGEVLLLDTATGAVVRSADGTGPQRVSSSDDGKVVAAVSIDATLRALEGTSGRVLWTAASPVAKGRPTLATAAIDPAGQHVLLALGGSAVLVRADTGAVVRRFELSHRDVSISDVAVGPERAVVASTSGLDLWDLVTGADLGALGGRVVTSCALSRDGRLAARADFGNTEEEHARIEVLPARPGAPVTGALELGKRPPAALALLDETTVAAVLPDGNAFVADLRGTPARVETIPFPALADRAVSVAPLENGAFLILTRRGRLLRFERAR